MAGLLQHSKAFLTRNAPTILTFVGSAGVIATGVLVALATPKAIDKVNKAEEEKGEELTKFETVKVVAPVYAPAVITGAATITCMFGANVLNKRKQASLISAYALLDNSYKEYRAKVKDIYGEEADTNVKREIAKDVYELSPVSTDKQLFFDFLSMQYFESTMEEVLKAEYEINKRMSQEYYVSVNDFYHLLNIPPGVFDYELGWSIEAGGAWYGYSWIDFKHENVTLEDGLECCIITMETAPTADFRYYS